jgi:transposase-like protein
VFEDPPILLQKWAPRAVAAWFMLSRLRLAMQDEQTGGKLNGAVEADETLAKHLGDATIPIKCLKCGKTSEHKIAWLDRNLRYRCSGCNDMATSTRQSFVNPSLTSTGFDKLIRCFSGWVEGEPCMRPCHAGRCSDNAAARSAGGALIEIGGKHDEPVKPANFALRLEITTKSRNTVHTQFPAEVYTCASRGIPAYAFPLS